MMTPIRVLIVDDHTIVREGLRTLLAEEAEIEVVGEAANGLEALGLVAMHQPQVVLMDLVMAGIDGIERKLEPGDAMDRNLYDLRRDEVEDLPSVCGSLREALDALAGDHEFLARGDVMPPDLVQAYIDVKRRELDLVERTPNPVEFQLYLSL